MGEMPQHTTSTPDPDISAEELAYLECERDYWGTGGSKEDIVWQRFNVSLPVYYERLYRISSTPRAERYDAAFVRRILDVADEVTAHRLGKQARWHG